MKILVTTALLAGVTLANAIPATAQESFPTPWCSVTSGIGKECYQNLAQCQQNIEGMGGFCSPTASWKQDQPMGYGEFPQRPN
jgi:hypothetical protein